jgi:hypothetical protein
MESQKLPAAVSPRSAPLTPRTRSMIGAFTASTPVLTVNPNVQLASASAPNLTPTETPPSRSNLKASTVSVKQGWTRDARKLVMMWTAQLEINRGIHQRNANDMGGLSTRLKIVSAVFGSASAFVSFLNTTFSDNEVVSITLSIIAGLFAAVATTIGVIGALLDLDGEAERHRQTAVQYANVCSEAQTILIEEDESNLPRATEYLRKMKEMTHLIQMFGPSLEAEANSDLPSRFLLQNLGIGEPVQSKGVPPLATSDSIFDHSRKQSLSERKRNRAAAIEDLRKNLSEIKQQKQAIADEENELKNLTTQLSQNFETVPIPRATFGSIKTNVSVGRSLRNIDDDNIDEDDEDDDDTVSPPRIAKGPNIPIEDSEGVVIEIPAQADLAPEMLIEEINRRRELLRSDLQQLESVEASAAKIKNELLQDREEVFVKPDIAASSVPKSITPPPIAKLFAARPDVRIQVQKTQQDKMEAINELCGGAL